MERYKSKFEEVNFRGNDQIIADSIEAKYWEYKPFYKRDEYGLIEAIAGDLKLGVDEVEYYFKKMRLV